MKLKKFQEYTSEYYSLNEFLTYIELYIENDSFVEKIEEEVEDYIRSEITLSPESYLYSYDIGDEGIDDVEVVECYFTKIKNTDLLRIDDEIHIIYELEFSINVTCTSYDYYGRDDDTREVVTSPPIFHEFYGDILITVERVIEKDSSKDSNIVDKYNIEDIDSTNLIQKNLSFHEEY